MRSPPLAWLYAPPDQSLAVQLGYTFTPPQLPPVEPELEELLLDELELLELEELLELLELEEELLEELELDEELLDELELLVEEPPPKFTSTQLKKRSQV
jgi:hypothetical protein